MKEIWKKYPKNKNYMVSNMGNIKSIDRYIQYPDGHKQFQKGKVLTPSLRKGYLIIQLSENGKRKTHAVNDMVAETFIPNPQGYTETHHKNYNKQDNRVKNIQWCSRKYNMNDKNKHYRNIYLRQHPDYTWDQKHHVYLKPCPRCGQLMQLSSKICLKCYQQNIQKQDKIGNTTITLKKLQEKLLLENGNFTKVANELNVSSSYLHKKLKKNGLPNHSRDYSKNH